MKGGSAPISSGRFGPYMKLPVLNRDESISKVSRKRKLVEGTDAEAALECENLEQAIGDSIDVQVGTTRLAPKLLESPYPYRHFCFHRALPFI